MQNHAANQLHVEMAHVEHTAARLADHGEGFLENLVEDIVCSLQALRVNLAQAIKIGIKFVRDLRHPVLNLFSEFVGLGAQFMIRELLHLRLERIDRLYTRQQALDLALISGAKNLA